MYGEGHYATYDGKKFMFEGRCEYVVTEDHCKGANGTFRIQAANVACLAGGMCLSCMYLSDVFLFIPHGSAR